MIVHLNARIGTQAAVVLGVTLILSACSAQGSSDTRGTIVTKSAGDPLPTITVDVSPQSVKAGEAAVIRWSTMNATSYAAFG